VQIYVTVICELTITEVQIHATIIQLYVRMIKYIPMLRGHGLDRGTSGSHGTGEQMTLK